MNTTTLPKAIQYLQGVDFPHKLGICDRLFGRRLSKEGICYVQTAAGIKWKLDLNNSGHRWIAYGVYEGSSFLNWAKKFLPRNGMVIDAGANIGQWLLYVAQLVPQGKVLAFEPGKEQADWLEECLSFNPELPVELTRCGVGSKSANGYLRGAGPSLGHGAWSQISETEGEPVCLVSLSDELKKRSIDKVDLLKMDVEGYEIPALQGVEEFLKDHRIRAIFSELYSEGGLKVRDFLRDYGYECYSIRPNGKIDRLTTLPEHTNGLFLPVQ